MRARVPRQPGMKGRDRSILPVRHKNGYAIRSLDAQQHPGLVGHQAIALKHRGHSVLAHVLRRNSPDQRGMNLAQRNQSEDFLAFGGRTDK